VIGVSFNRKMRDAIVNRGVVLLSVQRVVHTRFPQPEIAMMAANCCQSGRLRRIVRCPRSRRLPYTITAVRGDEKMRCQRDSALIAHAKARIWESEGWDVMVAGEDGRALGPAQLDAHVAAYRALETADVAEKPDLIGPRRPATAFAREFGDAPVRSARRPSAQKAVSA
jgi:hypothetical protein